MLVSFYGSAGVGPRALARWGQCAAGAPAWTPGGEIAAARGFAPVAVGADGAKLFPSRLLDAATLAANPCAIFPAAKAKAQTLALTTLVAMEMLKALSAVSLDHSLLRVAPWANPWLLAGVALPVALHLFLLHAPWLRGLFGLAPLTKAHWITVAKFSLPILLVEELTKAVGREVDRRERERRRAAASN